MTFYEDHRDELSAEQSAYISARDKQIGERKAAAEAAICLQYPAGFSVDIVGSSARIRGGFDSYDVADIKLPASLPKSYDDAWALIAPAIRAEGFDPETGEYRGGE